MYYRDNCVWLAEDTEFEISNIKQLNGYQKPRLGHLY